MNTSTAPTAPDARDYLGSYLRKTDIERPTQVNIVDVHAEDVPGVARKKLVVQFREFEKPLILNSTNIKALEQLFKTSETAHWRGAVVLYVDEQIEYAGQRVGGIRIAPAQPQPASPPGYPATPNHDAIPF